MDDATPIAKENSILDAAVEKLDAAEGFATLTYKGREIVLMTAEKFEEWEDAVDVARVQDSLLNPDPKPRITLDELRAKYDIPAPAK